MERPSDTQIRAQVQAALSEDVGSGDLTAALVPGNADIHARLIVREDAVLCGRSWFDMAFGLMDPGIRCDWLAADGDRVEAGQDVCRLAGKARAALTAERTALNFIQTLSATATLAARYVAAVSGTGATILDTRKTLPGLRLAQKYAVRCGGASNHRVGLFDAVLIKENHIRSAGSIADALAAVDVPDGVIVEIEVESLDELAQALNAGARRVLLDNFSLSELAAAVEVTAGRAQLEASGGVNLDTVADIAATGVDFISVGQLTKDVRAVDYSLLFAAV